MSTRSNFAVVVTVLMFSSCTNTTTVGPMSGPGQGAMRPLGSPQSKPMPSPLVAVSPAPTTSVTNAGSLALSLGSSVAIGVGDLQATGTSTAQSGALISVSSAGQLGTLALSTDAQTPTALSLLDTTSDAQVTEVLSLGAYGELVQAISRSNNQQGYWAHTDIAVVSPNGALTPLNPPSGTLRTYTPSASKIYPKLIFDGNAAVWALDSQGLNLYRFRLPDGTGALVGSAPSAQNPINSYAVAGTGDAFYSGGYYPSYFSQWLHADGSATTLDSYNITVGNPASYGDHLLTGSNPAPAVLIPHSDGTLDRIFVSQVAEGPSGSAWDMNYDRIGNWLATPLLALDMSQNQAVSNPFYQTALKNVSSIDTANGLVFDGQNVAKLSYDATAGLKVQHYMPIVSDGTKALRVISLYGPDQGFANPWVGIASDESLANNNGNVTYYWVEVDPTTGRVNSDPAHIWQIDFSASPYSIYQPNIFTPYQVGTSKVGLSGNINLGLFGLHFDNTTIKLTPSGQISGNSGYTYASQLAAINGGKLYFTASYDGSPSTNTSWGKSVYVYDPSGSGSVTLTTASLTLPSGSPSLSCTASQQNFIGIVASPSSGKPALIINQNCSNTSADALYVPYSDWTFSTATAAVDLGVDETQIDFNSSDTKNATFYPLTQTTGLTAGASVLAIGANANSSIKVLNVAAASNQQLATTSYVDLYTEGRIDWGNLFVTQMGYTAEIPAGGTLVLVNGKVGDSPLHYKTYKYDLATHARTELTALADLKFVTGAPIANGQILVTGCSQTDTNSSDPTKCNTPLNYVIGADGSLETATNTNISADKVVEIPANP